MTNVATLEFKTLFTKTPHKIKLKAINWEEIFATHTLKEYILLITYS